MASKAWIVAYRTADTHMITGPFWAIESKIKPTKWAHEHVYTDRPYQYAIKEVPEEQCGIRESEIAMLVWCDIEPSIVKRIRFRELETLRERGKALTDAQREEMERLFYELHPEDTP